MDEIDKKISDQLHKKTILSAVYRDVSIDYNDIEIEVIFIDGTKVIYTGEEYAKRIQQKMQMQIM
jgi:hypothetical protein